MRESTTAILNEPKKETSLSFSYIINCVCERADEMVQERLTALGIPFTRREHPAVFTVEQARLYDAGAGGAHCKNLFLRNKRGDRYYLLICEQSRPIDLRALGEQVKAGPLGLASEARLESVLGVTSGAVGPFALINDRSRSVTVLLDRDLRGADSLGFHPNINTATLYIAWAGLAFFLQHCGNPLQWID